MEDPYNPVDAARNINEVMYQLLYHADYQSIINYCKTDRQARELCKDISFWKNKAMFEFGISKEHFAKTKLSAILRYIQLLTKRGGVVIGSERFISANEMMIRAIKTGDNDVYNYLINNGYDNIFVVALEYGKIYDIEG